MARTEADMARIDRTRELRDAKSAPHGTTRHDLSQEIRERMIALLNQQLADTLDLRTQVKQAHWNVKGPHFIARHEVFDKLQEMLDEPIDDMAERVTALGGVAMGTTRIAAASSRLPELPHDLVDGMPLVALVADQYSVVAQSVRKAIDVATDVGDAGTADLFTAFSREIDQALWFLEAHLA